MLRGSETVGRSGGRQGAGVLWEFADAVADSAVGMGEVWFFFLFRIAYRAVGEEETTLEEGESLGCQEHGSGLQIFLV